MFHWFQTMLAQYGYGAVFLVVFLNNLLLPIPGDSTLVGAGFLAQKGVLAFWGVVASGTAGCFLGGCGGYWIGFRFGRRFLARNRWLPITPRTARHWELFFERFGPKFVFFARFVALLHPVTGLLTGIWRTPLRPFLVYNLAGAFAYSTLYVLLGYFFGQKWELFKTWIGPVALYGILIVAALGILGLFLRGSLKSFFGGPAQRGLVRKKRRPIRSRRPAQSK
ncbi:MAG TPA: DedA family protein [bacterium]|nr:DedA family protein [bacterium]